MVVVMAPDATQADLDGIVDLVRGAGGEAFITRGVSRTIVGLEGYGLSVVERRPIEGVGGD